MAVLRKTRILLAVVIACIILFTTRKYDYIPPAPDWATRLPSGLRSSQSAKGGSGAMQVHLENPHNPPSDESPEVQTPGEDELVRPPIPINQESSSSAAFSSSQTASSALATSSSSAASALVPKAHRLKSADEFLPHFKAVTQMEGLTMAHAKRTCSWPADTKVNFQYGDQQKWVRVDRGDAELEERRKQWHGFIENDLIPYSDVKDKFSGRGVVIVAGNQDTLLRTKVILRNLVKMGSTIDVEINYWGNEMNDTKKRHLEEIYDHIYFHDLSTPDNIIKIKKEGFYVNYQLKTAALVNSRFAEVILLDSDNIPVLDPASLFDSDEYQEYHSVFWPDIARTRPNNPAWPITNTPCRMDEYEQESGQLLVDKTRFFYHLQLATWFNNNQSDYYNEFLLGDKDMFRFAWHALKTQYGRPKKWITSVGVVNDGSFCGHSFAQHHPNGSVAFLHGGLVKTVDLEVIKWNKETQGGFYRSYKRTPYDEEPEHSVDVGIKFDSAPYKPEHTEKFHGAMCTDIFEVPPRDLDEIVPGFEKTFDEIGGYWMLEHPELHGAHR